MITAHQRGALASVALLLAIFFGLRACRNAARVPITPPTRGPLADQLMDRIDPNTAPLEDLAVLPGIGESHARHIVQYREENAHLFHGRPIFQTADDLLAIKGIGAAMVEKLKPYLTFPATQPSRRK